MAVAAVLAATVTCPLGRLPEMARADAAADLAPRLSVMKSMNVRTFAGTWLRDG
ncbi:MULTISPECIES: hypothetical protein [unclassified Bradyrhizobium]|uniref:hypothetical protein n=1 Tax=unclassified Bradyrhizobium TaxID=2631580 RepID=UPI002478DDC0|nr:MULTISPECIES: hypothetical protein [unclassified Bradyrhizobium]WGS20082.1 hypothetical protein MTX22_38265 [Bradyrhizobium sp. ISRA463]WGS26940.1 hypothetical protein MTX19_35690 [Bradyrhizobium sp. ISRA464]